MNRSRYWAPERPIAPRSAARAGVERRQHESSASASASSFGRLMMMRPLPKKRSARRRSTKATVVEALARRDAHRRSVRGVTAASLRSNAVAASPLNRLGQIRGDGGLRHGAAAARPPRRRAPGARTNSCQQKIRGFFTYRRACVCSVFRGKKSKIPFLPRSLKFKNGYFQRGFCLRLGLCAPQI